MDRHPQTDPAAPGHGIVFVLSLPRSGSTLLQRALVGHPAIHSKVSEPWLALRLFPFPRGIRTVSDVGWRGMEIAFEDLVDSDPASRLAYDRAAAAFLQQFYGSLRDQSASGSAQYYLDKTPRYLLIADQMIRAFPGAKFIVLVRNPLAVAASIIETWGRKGAWNLYGQETNLVLSLERLCAVLATADPRLHVLRYEDLVSRPQVELRRIADHLGIEDRFDIDHLGRPAGRLGDLSGVERYGERISTDSVDGWTRSLAPFWRRRWARQYIRWIGPERWRLLGYDLEEILARLEAEPVSLRHLVDDPCRIVAGAVRNVLKRASYAFLRRCE